MLIPLKSRPCVRTDTFVPSQSPRRPWPRFILLFALLACAVMPADGFARASGGYSRPGGYSRTPSLGSGGGYRTPSTSGGYSRPSPPYVRPPPSKVPQSPGDRSFPKTDPAPRLNATARNRMRLGASASTRQLRLVRRPQIHPTSTRPVSTDQPPLPIGLLGSTSAAGHYRRKRTMAAIATSDCGADCSSGRC
jgi:hypothetical protein